MSQSEPLIVPLSSANQSGTSAYGEALSYVFTGLSPVSSRFILYPYSFSASASTGAATYPQGALVSIPSTSTVPTDFSSLQATSTLNLNNAQAVYDSSVAFFVSYGVLTGRLHQHGPSADQRGRPSPAAPCWTAWRASGSSAGRRSSGCSRAARAA